MANWDRIDSKGRVSDRRSKKAGAGLGAGGVGLLVAFGLAMLSGG